MADHATSLRRLFDELEKEFPGLTVAHALALFRVLEEPGQTVGTYAKAKEPDKGIAGLLAKAGVKSAEEMSDQDFTLACNALENKIAEKTL